jgi:hypothetical protein
MWYRRRPQLRHNSPNCGCDRPPISGTSDLEICATEPPVQFRPLLLLTLLTFNLAHPQADDLKLHFAPSHGHPNNSEASSTPDESLAMEKQAGSIFVALAAHNHQQPVEPHGVNLTSALYGNLIASAPRHAVTLRSTVRTSRQSGEDDDQLPSRPVVSSSHSAQRRRL